MIGATSPARHRFGSNGVGILRVLTQVSGTGRGDSHLGERREVSHRLELESKSQTSRFEELHVGLTVLNEFLVHVENVRRLLVCRSLYHASNLARRLVDMVSGP